jgi:adenine-specific DNA methylase
MSERDSTGENRQDESTQGIGTRRVPETVAIEGDLPLTAIDIESQKDMNGERSHPLRGLAKWFAARPTPAARLSILASIYPGDIDPDELLSLMQIGPKEKRQDIAEYVEEKFAHKDERKSSEVLDEYYNFPNPNTQTPTESELQDFHTSVRNGWGQELPTVLDPTSGRGIIPFEALRYGLPTKANELNPIPVLISKVALEYAPKVGSITPEIHAWTEKIRESTEERISQYYPTEESGRRVLNSAMTYLIACDSCGGQVPLVGKWWLNKTTNGGDAVQPHYEDGQVRYEHIKVQDDDYADPSDAPVSRGGDAECPHCTIPMDAETIRKKFQEGKFEYSVYGVNYKTENGEWKWRSGGKADKEGINKAVEKIESDFQMVEFLSEEIPSGKKTNEVRNYGINQWRDAFSPRQLVAHYELFQAFEKHKQDIIERYPDEKAELILILLSMGIERQTEFNSRLSPLNDQRGYGEEVFQNNNFSIKRMFIDNNICAPRIGLKRRFEHVIDDSYERIASFLTRDQTGEVAKADAAKLTNKLDTNGADVAVVDPPYFDSIMYGELSDFSYVTMRRLLEDTCPELFETQLVRKKEHAVANRERHDDPQEFYQNKMKEIFNELSDILVDNGILTLMFTDREVQAWNTISKALIQSGFTITASHPIKTEMSDRIGAQDTASVSSSILLVARNQSEEQAQSVLWEEIKNDIEKTARTEAQRLLSIEDIDKIDASIAAFGPALQKYCKAYPVENKKGEEIEPDKVLTKARQVVTNVIANDELNTETDPVDGLTRWYILCYIIYDDANIPFDEANQLGIGTDIDVTEVYDSTRIWSRSDGDVDLNGHDYRVQDIVKLRDDRAKNPSSYWNPVNPTETTFTYAIDAVHSALHVYEQEGSQFARDWLAEREYKNDTAFITTVKALLEAVPNNIDMHDTLTDLVAGKTGDYLDISVSGLNIKDDNESQSGLEDFE